MQHSDWIPRKEQDLVALCQQWVEGLASPVYRTQFGWNTDECTAVSDKISAFLGARAAFETDNSTPRRIAKDTYKAEAISAMRDFANTSIRFNKRMAPQYRVIFGIREKDTTPSQETIPTSWPEAEAGTPVMRQVTIRFWDSGTKKRGKPDHVHGAEIRWAVLDQPAASIDELIHSDFDTASPFTLNFGEEDRGKRVYFCLRWETHTNLKGPFSEIYMAIIP